jgi:hypothetical protein
MTRKRKTGRTTEQRAAEAAALRDRLEEFEGEADEETLAAIFAQFDGYSERNAMLIAMQCPGATDVSGFAAWKDRGRAVKKGETGIRILAPAGSRDATEATEATETAPAAEAKAARQFFRLVSVFDVSQTEPLEQAQARWAAQAAERAAAAAALAA